MASFPVLSSGSVAQYPLADTRAYRTVVHQFENDKEQRYTSRVALREFTLTFAHISEADYTLIEEFFDARAGGFDSTWDITVNGTLVPNCSFVEDSLVRTEARPGYVSLVIRIRQTRT